MTPTVRNLFEAHVSVADLDSSAAFYREVVGLHPAHVVTGRAVFFWIGPRGNAMLGLWAAGPGPQKMTTHVAFSASVEDVLAAPKALRAAGIVPLDFDGQPTNEPIVLAWMPAVSVYFRDPDAHLLEYIAMLPDEPCPDRGIVPWREWRGGLTSL